MSDTGTILTTGATPRSRARAAGDRSSVTALHAHLQFVTKYRRPVATDPLLADCPRLTPDIRTDVGAQLREFNRETDQMYFFVHFWSPSYFAASCDGAPLSIVKQYIEQPNRPE